MAGVLHLSDWEFKTTTTHMLRALMNQVDSMQEPVKQRDGNPLEISNTVIVMKNAFDRPMSIPDMVEERLSNLEDMSIETSRTEKRRRKRLKK